MDLRLRELRLQEEREFLESVALAEPGKKTLPGAAGGGLLSRALGFLNPFWSGKEGASLLPLTQGEEMLNRSQRKLSRGPFASLNPG